MLPLRTARMALLLLAALAAGGLAGCGSDGSGRGPTQGTVILVNESDQGMAPLTVEEFFLQPVGVIPAGDNLLKQDLLPGAVVIVGLYPPGLYNAVAVLSSGLNIPFVNLLVRAGEPTNVVIPGS